MAEEPPFNSQPGRLWLLKVPKALEEQWANAQPGDDLGVVEDDGQLRLRPNAGPTKAFELQRTQGADVRAFQEVAPPPKKQKTDEEDDDPVTGRLLGRPQGTLVPRPAAGTSYRRVCSARMVQSLKPERATQMVDASDVPRADRAPVVAFGGRGKGETEQQANKKRKQLPRATLRSRLFGIFGASADPLALKEINERLGDDAQPDPFLKDVLSELATHVRVSGRVCYASRRSSRTRRAAAAAARGRLPPVILEGCSDAARESLRGVVMGAPGSRAGRARRGLAAPAPSVSRRPLLGFLLLAHRRHRLLAAVRREVARVLAAVAHALALSLPLAPACGALNRALSRSDAIFAIDTRLYVLLAGSFSAAPSATSKKDRTPQAHADPGRDASKMRSRASNLNTKSPQDPRRAALRVRDARRAQAFRAAVDPVVPELARSWPWSNSCIRR